MDAPHALVLRVESLFGSPAGWTGRRGSVDAMVDGIQAGREIPVLTDRVVSPSYSPDVAAATRHLLDRAAPAGVYHCVNTGHATWEIVAMEIARQLGVEPKLKRLTTDQLTLRAARPRYCALSTAKLATQGFTMPTWEDALARWLAGIEWTPRMAKRAIISGITGQDGSYLAELLLDKGYEVTGIVRRSSSPNIWRIEHLLDRITLRPADLLDQLSLVRVIQDVSRRSSTTWRRCRSCRRRGISPS